MLKDGGLENAMGKAGELEKNYDWLGAVKFYEKALGLVLKSDFLKIGEIQEKIGYALYRTAMQAESVNQFRNRMRRAIAGYERAKEVYGKLSGQRKTPWMLRCGAMIAYMGYWLTSEVPEKKRLLDECWQRTKEALKAFKEAGEAWEYGRTYNQLSTSALFRYFFEWDFQARGKMLREAMEHGEQAIAFLSTFDDPCELARACVTTATFFEQLGVYFVSLDEKQGYFRKVQEYWQNANELSEETAQIESLISFIEQVESLDLGTGTDRTIANRKKALEYGKKTRDRFIVGSGLDHLAHHTYWKAEATEDPDERDALFKLALKYAEDAQKQYSQISFRSPRSGSFIIELSYATYYLASARFETNPRKKRDLLEKAMTVAPEGLNRTEDSGFPLKIWRANDVFSGILTELAKIEANSDEKRRFLERALKHRKESVRLTDQFEPFFYWNRGAVKARLADVESELADLAENPENKKSMLQEAILDKEDALNFCTKHLAFWESESIDELMTSCPVLGLWQSEYGGLLKHFYELTKSEEHLRKAVEAYEEAAESYKKVNQASRMAECYWKAARAYDALGEHLKAAESFGLASDNYKGAAEKIPQLKDFYQDHAIYMRAWNDIEKARHHHDRQEYSSAKEYYEKAVTTHESLKQWSYLARNYSAWTHVENAEDLSRRERSEEALQTFEQAAKLFAKAKNSLQNELNRIENADEKQMAIKLIEASDRRRTYCIGRMALEEAKIFDKKGDHHSSSLKYDSAAQTFGEITEALESEQDRKELKLITILSRAWRKMTQAETESSPSLYLEASQLFEEAKELSPNERARMLALGHSRFCRALEAGTKFTDTRDVTLHTTAIQSLESAANYYMKAGFQNASEYAKATELLFDAYVYMDNAKKETDPEKKAKLYMMAEKVLQSSAASFKKAEHPEKKEQVLKLLDKVKEERELALSLSEVLHAPSTVSTTSAFTTPTSTYENAVGLERFEHAYIQAHLTTSEEATLGEEFEIRLDLVNVGKESALLVSIEGLVPPTFKITKAPPDYNIEDYTLDVKGKRLEPQKVESIKISAKATKTGVTILCPQITYVDELGKFHTHKPATVQNTILPTTGFQFKTESAEKVFEYLAKAFIEEYMKQKLTLEKAGWRTLTRIMENAKTPKSSVYGTVGRKGPAIAELEGRGLIETRIFLGKRGRGGRILQARIYYEKEIVKRYIDQRVMKINEK